MKLLRFAKLRVLIHKIMHQLVGPLSHRLWLMGGSLVCVSRCKVLFISSTFYGTISVTSKGTVELKKPQASWGISRLVWVSIGSISICMHMNLHKSCDGKIRTYCSKPVLGYTVWMFLRGVHRVFSNVDYVGGFWSLLGSNFKWKNYIEGNQGAGVISIFQTLGVSRSSPRSSGQHILGTDCWVFCFGKGQHHGTRSDWARWNGCNRAMLLGLKNFGSGRCECVCVCIHDLPLLLKFK